MQKQVGRGVQGTDVGYQQSKKTRDASNCPHHAENNGIVDVFRLEKLREKIQDGRDDSYKEEDYLTMTKTQIINFVKKIAKKGVIIIFCKNHNEDGLHAYVIRNTPQFIFIHLKDFNKFNLIEQKETLMHEVGHVKTIKGCHSKTEEELKAQIWGIQKAKELGMTQVVRMMKETLKQWKYFKWNSCNRKYLMAAMLAKEKRVI